MVGSLGRSHCETAPGAKQARAVEHAQRFPRAEAVKRMGFSSRAVLWVWAGVLGSGASSVHLSAGPGHRVRSL